MAALLGGEHVLQMAELCLQSMDSSTQLSNLNIGVIQVIILKITLWAPENNMRLFNAPFILL